MQTYDKWLTISIKVCKKIASYLVCNIEGAWFITLKPLRWFHCVSLAWFITFRFSVESIAWAPAWFFVSREIAERDKSRPYGWRHFAVYAKEALEKNLPRTGVMNNINKKAILSIHTSDICRHIIVRWRKTLIFCIKQKALIIRVINVFIADKNTNQFQEPPLLESKTTASCW